LPRNDQPSAIWLRLARGAVEPRCHRSMVECGGRRDAVSATRKRAAILASELPVTFGPAIAHTSMKSRPMAGWIDAPRDVAVDASRRSSIMIAAVRGL
jgi:hypothetical protein